MTTKLLWQNKGEVELLEDYDNDYFKIRDAFGDEILVHKKEVEYIDS